VILFEVLNEKSEESKEHDDETLSNAIEMNLADLKYESNEDIFFNNIQVELTAGATRGTRIHHKRGEQMELVI
jgi:hypothetical protein